MADHEAGISKKVIGVLGGLGPESTIEFYRALTQKYYLTYQDYAYPELIILSFDFQEFIDAGYCNAAVVVSAIERLATAGAAFVVAPCNSVHRIYEQVCRENDLPIPWVSIMESTVRTIQGHKCTKVGLLGTIFTMSQPFFSDRLRRDGIETLLPDSTDQNRVNRIIYDELVRGVVTPEARSIALDCIDRLAQAGADGIVLGCTELPLLLKRTDIPLPVFDTTDLQAQHALDISLGLEPLSHCA